MIRPTLRPSATRQLVRSVWSNTSGPLETGDVEAARRLLLDFIGVATWGAKLDAGRIMSRHAVNDLTYDGPRLPIFGTGEDAPALAAVMASSVAACAFEFDDTHTGASAHPGAVVFPASLAAARLAAQDDTRTFLRSIIVGYEVMIRVARAVNPHAHRARHFHPTSTAGHFGAAAAAAVCLGLDEDETVAALALAGTMAGGSMQFLVEGAWTKQVHAAFAVQRAVHAAQLAAQGFPGVEDPIAGERAFLNAQSEDPRPERLLEGLGEGTSAIQQTGIKPYPTCRRTQSPLDALLEVVRAHEPHEDEVAAIRLGLVESALGTIWEPVEAKRRPKSVADAQFSMPYVAAVAIRHGGVSPSQFTAEELQDARNLTLADRVQCVHDPELDVDYPRKWPAWAEVVTRDGRRLVGRVEYPLGDPENPLSWEDLTRKFAMVTEHAYEPSRRDEIQAAVRGLPETSTLAELLALC